MTSKEQKNKVPVALKSKNPQNDESLEVLLNIRGQLAVIMEAEWSKLITLESIDGSINILAMQKARELNPSPAEGDSTQ